MPNFIFSVAEIFNECLTENKVEGYYIGPYQRGYKWKSERVHDQVPVLLCDLFEAYLKQKEKQGISEYYLQYITVKKTQYAGKSVFEVIDGQQRLTTITLLFSVLEHSFGKVENVAKKDGVFLVQYARYQNLEASIFYVIESLRSDNTTKIREIGEQDKYYMYLAAQKIGAFFTLLYKEDHKQDFEDFISFIKKEVKIILNQEDEFTSAEEVFSSLNGNKVPLTDAYLVKGLLLTKASRGNSLAGGAKHFREIMDERTLMAKTWDEMQNWFSQPEIGQFFFKSESAGMEAALRLINHPKKQEGSQIIKKFKSELVESEQDSKSKRQYEIFNSFNENILTAEDARNYLDRIKHLYKRLRNWFEDNGIYNRLGYCLAKKSGTPRLLIEDFVYKDNKEFKEALDAEIRRLINYTPLEIEKLSYEGEKPKIQCVLLALSVFPEGVGNGWRTRESYRFDFYSYEKDDWSLEHIFPQTPTEKDLNWKKDKEWIINQCNKYNQEHLLEKISNLKEDEDIALEELGFIFENFSNIHNLGNMALLSRSVNSTLKNGLFDAKRKVLLKRINAGSFVPKHTLDVFSKMLQIQGSTTDSAIDFDPDLKMWTEQDAEVHLSWMKNRIATLTKQFEA